MLGILGQIELCCGINRNEGGSRRNQARGFERRFANMSQAIDIAEPFVFSFRSPTVFRQQNGRAYFRDV